MKTYFVHAKQANKIKIGKTTRLPQRISGLQTGSAEKLTVVHVMSGDHEAEMHGRFSHLHSHGEWFEFRDELLEFIQNVANSDISTPLTAQPSGVKRGKRQWLSHWDSRQPPTGEISKPGLTTVKEAARILEVTELEMRNAIYRCEVPVKRFGRTTRVPYESLRMLFE